MNKNERIKDLAIFANAINQILHIRSKIDNCQWPAKRDKDPKKMKRWLVKKEKIKEKEKTARDKKFLYFQKSGNL